jgi:hypothetical protein
MSRGVFDENAAGNSTSEKCSGSVKQLSEYPETLEFTKKLRIKAIDVFWGALGNVRFLQGPGASARRLIH